MVPQPDDEDDEYPSTRCWPLRVQRDSTCSGEVISRPFYVEREESEWLTVMRTLQNVAIDNDAEPGPSSGFHVHVMPMLANGGTQRTGRLRQKVLWAFLLWEPALERIAAGRFQEVRSMNTRVRDSLHYWLTRNGITRPFTNVYSGVTRYDELVQNLDNETRQRLMQEMYDNHCGADRHSNLNTSTNYNTIEFRLWNSTRSAWRMELFSRLSVALCDPAVVEVMIDTAEDRVPERLTDILGDYGYERTVELLHRQLRYSRERAATAPLQLSGV